MGANHDEGRGLTGKRENDVLRMRAVSTNVLALKPTVAKGWQGANRRKNVVSRL